MTAEPDEETAPTYLDSASIDEQRRAYVLECMTACGDASAIHGAIFVENLNHVCEWLKTAIVPTPTKPKGR